MKTYTIRNRSTGCNLGDYEGDTVAEALDTYARDAGYANFPAACAVSGDDGDIVRRSHDTWQVGPLSVIADDRGVLDDEVVVAGVAMSMAAARCAEEAGADVANDVYMIRSGLWTAERLAALCLDGSDEDRVPGWRDYVAAVVAAAEVAS